MRKRYTPFITLLLIWSFIGQISAQTFQVQVAAFIEDIDQSFFEFAGYNNVYAEKDHNNFVRYTLGEFFTLDDANNARKEAIRKGFLNTYINTLDKPMFAYVGDAHDLPLIMVPEKEELFIRSVEFAAEDLSLSKALMTSLEEALVVMKQNPDLKLRIVGHTDDIGEVYVNQAISKKRARMIQNFLLANEIPAYRLKMKVSDEPSPAVYFKGKGLPQTRDFNRRIIMTLVDLKDEIVVDDFQQKEEVNKTLSAINKVTELMRFIKLA